MKRNGFTAYYNITKYIIEGIVVTLFIAVIFFQSLNIFFRYTKIAYSIVWVEEFTRFSFVWITFLLWSLADRNGSHFMVGLFLDKLNKRKRMYLEILIDLLIICFVFVLIWASFEYIPGTMSYHTDSIIWLRMGIIYLVIPFGSALVFIERVLMLVIKINILRKK
mgnify:CR=1 FL=1